MNLKSWLEYNDIEYFQDGNVYTINEVKYYHIHHKDDKIFDSDFKLIISDQELLHLDQDNIENLIFYFGTQWYYTSLYKTELNLLKYLGKSKKYSNTINGFLGIHGKYEILNGTRDYNDWCKKALFLGYNSLGICEKHTLSGSYVFQQACQKNNIKSIIGETLSININGNIIDVKIYVKNQIGWENLLKLHKIHNIDNYTNKHILKQDLLNHYQGLCYVITPDSNLDLLDDDLLNLRDIYYQLDFCQFISNNKDKDRILNIGKYLQELRLSPILINDAYYLDSEDYKTKILLNEIGKTGFQNLSKDQYLKSYQDIIDSGISLFKDQRLYNNIIEIALDNCNQLCNECNFIIEKKHSYLPKYIMNGDEKLKFSDNKQLFYAYIEDGFTKKVLNKNLDFEKYQERLLYEIEVLEKGNVIDYFLILSDIVNFCKKQNILTGIGRGSAAGSLVAYLLNIVEIDPIQYDLLFERFLNEGRLLKGTLPDIDQDVPSKHRADIIQYVIHKYGENNVVSIGTAQNFKLKSLFKDLLKYKGESFKDANNLSISLPRELDMGKKVDLFKSSISNKNLKNSLNKHADVVEDLDKIIGQPRSFGKHAAGVVITPNLLSDRDTVVSSDLIPLRRDGDINITEWEKDILENNGFLKLDLLGLSQLDKIMEIIKLIKERHNTDINILEIPLDDTLTFELFKKGLNEDVFQFGAVGLKEYCKQLQPDTIHDLIATVALYRPGSMGSGSHLRYIDVKKGLIPTNYYKGTESILKDTLSVLIYQEQVMRICTDLAGFTLKEADDVRKAISKKDLELLHRLKVRFVSSIQELSQYTEQEAEDLWKDIEYFGEYSFNKSHAACYATTGYYTQWLKAHYPSEFYTVALSHSDDFTLPNIINEISSSKVFDLHHPDINKSNVSFNISSEDNVVYWGLLSIKFLGEKSVLNILKERQQGEFYSFSEFISRCGSFLNKRVLINLTLTGALDKINNITDVRDRSFILEKFLEKNDVNDIVKKYQLKTLFSFNSIQKQLCGFDNVNFTQLNEQHKCTSFENLPAMDGKNCKVCGVVDSVKEFKTAKGVSCAVKIQQSGKTLDVVFWSEHYQKYKTLLNQDSLLLVSGFVKKDLKYSKVQLQVNNFSTIQTL